MRQRRKVVRLKRKLVLGPDKRGGPSASPQPSASPSMREETDVLADEGSIALAESVSERGSRRLSRASFHTDDSMLERK